MLGMAKQGERVECVLGMMKQGGVECMLRMAKEGEEVECVLGIGNQGEGVECVLGIVKQGEGVECMLGLVTQSEGCMYNICMFAFMHVGLYMNDNFNAFGYLYICR